MTQLDYEIYCDYDGVLVDFRKGIKDLSGYVIKSFEYKDTRREITVDFWENLEPMPDWKILWDVIEPHNPHILTAYPKWDDDAAQKADIGKRSWNRKYTKVPEDRMHVVERKGKKYFATSYMKRNILIDDDPDNIYEWSRAGGIAIHHENALKTIEALKILGYGTK